MNPTTLEPSTSAAREARSSKLNVVLFSGGSGTQSITEAFLKHPQISLTILINAYDDGHSTGRLRRFIPGMLGPSDVRKNINRLTPQSDERHRALRFLSDHRLPVGPAEQVLESMRGAVPGIFGELPGVLALHRTQQAT